MVIIQWCGEHEAALQQQVSLGPCAETSVLLGQSEWPACRGGCLVRTVRMARVQRWVSCQVKQKGLFPGMRLVFEKQAYRCRPMDTAKHSWRGLGIRDADKERQSLPKSCR